ncbi:hypothetical protein CYMTET_46174, partial [Cymbomonas tetramitiformis]
MNPHKIYFSSLRPPNKGPTAAHLPAIEARGFCGSSFYTLRFRATMTNNFKIKFDHEGVKRNFMMKPEARTYSVLRKAVQAQCGVTDPQLEYIDEEDRITISGEEDLQSFLQLHADWGLQSATIFVKGAASASMHLDQADSAALPEAQAPRAPSVHAPPPKMPEIVPPPFPNFPSLSPHPAISVPLPPGCQASNFVPSAATAPPSPSPICWSPRAISGDDLDSNEFSASGNYREEPEVSPQCFKKQKRSHPDAPLCTEGARYAGRVGLEIEWHPAWFELLSQPFAVVRLRFQPIQSAEGADSIQIFAGENLQAVGRLGLKAQTAFRPLIDLEADHAVSLFAESEREPRGVHVVLEPKLFEEPAHPDRNLALVNLLQSGPGGPGAALPSTAPAFANSKRLYMEHAETGKGYKLPLPNALAMGALRSGLKEKLFNYQLQGVQWMVQRERLEDPTRLQDKLDPMWALFSPGPVPQSDAVRSALPQPILLYYHLRTGQFTERPESAGAVEVRGGVLADEMGLGKTVMTVAVHVANPLHTPALPSPAGAGHEDSGGQSVEASGLPIPVKCTMVVVPQHILYQWLIEVNHHCRGKVAVYLGCRDEDRDEEVPRWLLSTEEFEVVQLKGRGVSPESFLPFDFVLMSINTLKEEVRFTGRESKQGITRHDSGTYHYTPLMRTLWWRLVVDEGTKVGRVNHGYCRLAQQLLAENRWCLSGTPLDADLKDMEGILAFLDEGGAACSHAGRRFMPRHLWAEAVKALKEGRAAPWVEPVMVAVLERIMLRRTKAMVADELEIPSQHSVVKSVDLSAVERWYYARIAHHVREDLRSERDKQEKYRFLSRLRGACIHMQTSMNTITGRGTGWEDEMFFKAVVPVANPTHTRFFIKDSMPCPLSQLRTLCIGAMRYNMILEYYLSVHENLKSADQSYKEGATVEAEHMLKAVLDARQTPPPCKELLEAGEMRNLVPVQSSYEKLRRAIEKEFDFAHMLLLRVLEGRRAAVGSCYEELRHKVRGTQNAAFTADFEDFHCNFGEHMEAMSQRQLVVTADPATHYWRTCLEDAERNSFSEHFAKLFEMRQDMLRLHTAPIEPSLPVGPELVDRHDELVRASKEVERYRNMLLKKDPNISKFTSKMVEDQVCRTDSHRAQYEAHLQEIEELRDEAKMFNTENPNSLFSCKKRLLSKMKETQVKPESKSELVRTNAEWEPEGAENARWWLDRFISLPIPPVQNVYGSKITLVLHELSQLAPSKVIVVATSADTLAIMMHALKDKGVKFQSSSMMEHRQHAITSAAQKFQNEKDVQVFLLNGVQDTQGLTLTAAEHIFLLDPILDPAARRQCYGRVHRLGQKKKTTVHHFVAEDTIERIMFDKFVHGDMCAVPYGGPELEEGREESTGSADVLADDSQ